MMPSLTDVSCVLRVLRFVFNITKHVARDISWSNYKPF
jgi:hypothetical protein